MRMSFKLFLEDKQERIHDTIPVHPNIMFLSRIFAENNYLLYIVGGAVRDYLFHKFHGYPFNSKDTDLATDASADKVIRLLQDNDIKYIEKGIQFGVVSALFIKDKYKNADLDSDLSIKDYFEEYEIATFRTDGKYTDGRRPDSISLASPEEDAKRRDLTINALFYDINKKQIIDYNDGQGIKDIKERVVRPVGDAKERFAEDKLRITRLVRFFCRFNSGIITDKIDEKTYDAVQEFKNLQGVSPERIAAEFISGLKSCLNTENYLRSIEELNLFPSIFPGISIDKSSFQQLKNSRNISVVLAWIFKQNNSQIVRDKLNKLKYTNDVADSVAFLIKLLSYKENQIPELLKYKKTHPKIIRSIIELGDITNRKKEFEYFANYQPVANIAMIPTDTPPSDRGKMLNKIEIDNFFKYAK